MAVYRHPWQDTAELESVRKIFTWNSFKSSSSKLLFSVKRLQKNGAICVVPEVCLRESVEITDTDSMGIFNDDASLGTANMRATKIRYVRSAYSCSTVMIVGVPEAAVFSSIHASQRKVLMMTWWCGLIRWSVELGLWSSLGIEKERLSDETLEQRRYIPASPRQPVTCLCETLHWRWKQRGFPQYYPVWFSFFG
jgi:hypothetical protein